MITIISGGTQGLGEAVACRLHDRGLADGLVLTGRSVDRGEALAAELSAAGSPTLFLSSEASDPAMPGEVVGACLDRFGRVDGLVNVAALTTRATLFDDTPEHVDHMFAVNVKAPYFLVQAAARAMVEQGDGGSIVNVGSVAGHGGAPKLTAYAMSKAALSVMTRNLAFGLLPHGVRINQVNPGWMETESEHHIQITEDGAPDDWLVAANASRPLGRLVQPWEVANAIVFCLSPESGCLTGNSIDVDQTVLGAGEPPAPSITTAIPVPGSDTLS